MATNNRTGDAFLVSEYTSTYRLKKLHKNTIGRDDNNNIVLKNLLVSRHHAEIIWLNNDFILTDLSSQNGTLLNEKSLDSAVLKHGDNIKIGGFEFIVQFSSYQDIMRVLSEEKGRAANRDTIKVSSSNLMFGPDKMEGSLDSIRLIEFIQMLHQSRKSGCLALRTEISASDYGLIYFERGDIVHAVIDDEKGIPVVMKLLQWTEGYFEFKDTISPPERTILQSVDWILLRSSPEE